MKNYLRRINRLHFYFQDFQDFLKSKSSWWSYIILIGVLFGLCWFKIIGIYTYSPFDDVKDLAHNKIDNRITEIATVFSIAFIIIGFLIEKMNSYSKYTNRVFYTLTRLFPILYFNLSVIGGMIIISSFSLYIEDDITFVNLFYMGVTLIVISIFLTGFLFKKVISITPEDISDWYFNEMKIKSKHIQHKYKVEKNKKALRKMRTELNEELIDAAKKGNLINLKNILNIYEDICKLNNGEDEKELKEYIDYYIVRVIHEAIDYNRKEIIEEVICFITRVLNDSFQSKNDSTFKSFIYLPSYYYSKIYKFQIALKGVDSALEALPFYISFHLNEAQSIQDLRKINDFINTVFEGYRALLYKCIRNKDLNSFKKGIEKYADLLQYINLDNIPFLPKNEPYFYRL